MSISNLESLKDIALSLAESRARSADCKSVKTIIDSLYTVDSIHRGAMAGVIFTCTTESDIKHYGVVLAHYNPKETPDMKIYVKMDIVLPALIRSVTDEACPDGRLLNVFRLLVQDLIRNAETQP